MTYVLDTNVITAALNGREAVVDRFNRLPRGEALLPAMVLVELRYGALSSHRVEENLARVERILDLLVFVPVDRSIVERFGEIKAAFRKRGVAKSDADLLIAATAVEEGGVLVTGDAALLDGSISGLEVEDWLGF